MPAVKGHVSEVGVPAVEEVEPAADVVLVAFAFELLEVLGDEGDAAKLIDARSSSIGPASTARTAAVDLQPIARCCFCNRRISSPCA